MTSAKLPIFLRLLMLAASATLAFSHVTINPSTIVPDGGYFRVAMRLPHGCSGATEDGPHNPTMKFQVDIPAAVATAATARPEMVANWAINITDNADGSRTVVWSAESPKYYLPDEYFMEFGISMKVPPGAEGTGLMFPSTQYCTNNTMSAWVEPTEDADKPAPTLTYAAECTCDAQGAGMGTIQPTNTTTNGTAPPTSSAYSTSSLGLMAMICAVPVLASLA